MSKRERNTYITISGIFFLAIVFCVGNRLMFLQEAAFASGSVVAIHSANHRCKQGKGRPRPCTQFTASVDFELETGQRHMISLDAGSSNDFDRPVSEAHYTVGQQVPVVYKKSDPNDVALNSFWRLWGMTVFFSILLIVTVIAWQLTRIFGGGEKNT